MATSSAKIFVEDDIYDKWQVINIQNEEQRTQYRALWYSREDGDQSEVDNHALLSSF